MTDEMFFHIPRISLIGGISVHIPLLFYTNIYMDDDIKSIYMVQDALRGRIRIFQEFATKKVAIMRNTFLF